ncbi:MAG: radical SAM protein [Parcubacteria group bacterium]|nr:radical SAM protein [Parcubacteria group bacterium]
MNMPKLVGAPTENEICSVVTNGKLLTLWVEIPPHCHLNCGFCFNNGGNQVIGPNALTKLDYSNILQEFANMGGKTLAIPGNGEPLYKKNLRVTLHILDYAKELGIRTTLFTTGDLVDVKIASRLYETGVSLMVKFNSFHASVQDQLVGNSRYTERRKKALKIISDIGFMQRLNGFTRIGFVTSILPENTVEIPQIWQYCLENNIAPDIDLILPLGRSDGNSEFLVAADTVNQISSSLTGNNMCSPTYLGEKGCQRPQYGLYMDYTGSIYPCLGCKDKSHSGSYIPLGEKSLSTAWNLPLMQKIRSREYSGTCAECANFKNGDCSSCFGRCCIGCTEETVTMEKCMFFR